MRFEERIPCVDRSTVYLISIGRASPMKEPMKNHAEMAVEPLDVSPDSLCVGSVIKSAKIHFSPRHERSIRSGPERA